MTDMPLSVTPAPRLTPLLALRDFGGVAKRNLIRSVRTPQLVLYAIQPIMMLLLFRYIFGGAIKVAGGDYTEFVVPAIFLLALLVGAMTSAIGIAEDVKSGMIDRFRSLPMARSAVLTGRSLTDLIRSVISLAVLAGLGLAVGFRFHSDAGRILLGMLLILAFGYAFSWMNTVIGISAKEPGERSERRHRPCIPSPVRQQRHRARGNAAGLAAAVRPQPAAGRHRLGGPRTLRGRRGGTRRLGVAGLVRRDHRACC